jgi:tetrahydromethanopterin S-methyltransferase subunit H
MVQAAEKYWDDTGVPVMADIVASPGEKFNKYVDFIVENTKMPFCVDAIQMKTKLQGAEYCAEKGLLDRMFYNSLTIWEEELETEIKEMANIGVKHVLLVAFDPMDQMPTGRITGAQKLLDAIEKVGAEFETVIVDTTTLNAPATAMCGLANKLIKEKWGYATASAPSNGSWMEYKRFKDELWDFKSWAAVDSAVEALTAFFFHDLNFTGPMVSVPRVLPAIALADAFLATTVFDETKTMPAFEGHPIYKLWPDFADTLKSRWQETAEISKVER